MTSIIVPKLIGMDTSTLCGLASDLSSSLYENRRKGQEFIEELSYRGWFPTISFENIIEMLQHGNAQVAINRISMFAKLPQLAYVDSLKYSGFPGTIVDVLAREVRACLTLKRRDVLSIASMVRSDLFGFCTGRKIVEWLYQNIGVLWRIAQRGFPRDKILSSVSHIDIMEIGNQKIGSIRANAIINQSMIKRHGCNLRNHMKTELRTRGVAGVNHDAFAENFASDSETRLLEIAGPEGRCTFGEFIEKSLQEHGIDPAQINKNTTVNDIASMAGFNHKLKVASRLLVIYPPLTVREIPMDKCPSEIVQSGVDIRRRSAPKALSGDLMDSHLSTLGCYCNVTIVDKRTKEYIRQLRKQSSVAKALIREVVCLSKYTDLLAKEF
jgi:hypothetical protein